MVRNASESVIRISERNPHYYSYRGKELLLLTSAEHYGAVMNGKFDYRAYLDALSRFGLNYTRIYPATAVLIQGMNRKNDNLAPGPDLIAPWARSDVPGYIGGGNKFDLGRWDDEFFRRLDDFMRCAHERDIIVELCFFNSQHERSYPYSPLHPDANIQGVGTPGHAEVETLQDKNLVQVQLELIEKLIIETNQYDNLIYEFCDEPTLDGTKGSEATAWLSALIDRAIKVEDQLPKKHLLAQQVMIGVDFSGDDRIGVNVAQYVSVSAGQIGGLPALNNSYWKGKPLEMNETLSALSDPVYYEGDVVAASRIEAWEFMMGGGAGFNQLNACFTVQNPAGNHPVNHEILTGLGNLRNFIESMDFAKMTRDSRTIQALSVGGSANGISEAGRQYAFYLHHCFTNYRRWHPSHYVPTPGLYNTVITIKIDPGEYLLQFINPADLSVLSSQIITSDGEDMDIQCPEYTLDIAFKITRN